MRLSPVLLAVLYPVVVVGVDRGSGDTQPKEVLGVVTSFAHEPSHGLFQTVKSELEVLLRIPILRLEWRELDTLPVYESFDHLVVARFYGHCETITSENKEDTAPTLGFTHVSDGQVIPFMEIDCDRVSRALGKAKTAEPAAQREHRMGRALARVLAHEIYHILAETRDHARSGLAKVELSERDLTCEWMSFEKADLERIRAKVANSMHALSSPHSGTN